MEYNVLEPSVSVLLKQLSIIRLFSSSNFSARLMLGRPLPLPLRPSEPEPSEDGIGDPFGAPRKRWNWVVPAIWDTKSGVVTHSEFGPRRQMLQILTGKKSWIDILNKVANYNRGRVLCCIASSRSSSAG